MRAWDDFDAGAVDASGSDEVTVATRQAHDWALVAAQRAWGAGGDWEYAGGYLGEEPISRLRIRTPHGYLVEVRGQSSATGHGKHGADPRHLAELREVEMPSLLLFVEPGAKTLYAYWLQDDTAPVVDVDTDRTHRRQGWHCRDMERCAAALFTFPEAAPDFPTRGLF